MSTASRQVWNWREEKPQRRRERVVAGLRRHGLVGGLVALAVGTLLNKVLGHATIGRVVVAIGALQALTALWRPLLLEAPLRWLRRFGHAVGSGLAWLLLGSFWLLVFVPGGLWLRATGRDPLHRAPLDRESTAWIPRRHAPDPASARRQFLDEDPSARDEHRPVGTLPEPALLAEIEARPAAGAPGGTPA